MASAYDIAQTPSKESPMNAIGSAAISILAIGLLLVPATTMVAQDAEAVPSAAPGPTAADASSFTLEFSGHPEIYIHDPDTGFIHTASAPVTATDPRASGLLSAMTASGDVGDFENPPWYAIRKEGIRIENEAGAWVGSHVRMIIEHADERTKRQKKRGKGQAPLRFSGGLYELTGEGAYEGLSMFLSAIDGRILAVIIPTESAPPMPEPPPPSVDPQD